MTLFTSVAVKHYLRGEEGIYYEDLYHLLKHLPAYALPAGLPPMSTRGHGEDPSEDDNTNEKSKVAPQLPLPVTTPSKDTNDLLTPPVQESSHPDTGLRSLNSRVDPDEEPHLLPSYYPPQSSLFDIFPLSLIGSALRRKGTQVAGKKAARKHATRRVVSHNIPMEITLYLVSTTLFLFYFCLGEELSLSNRVRISGGFKDARFLIPPPGVSAFFLLHPYLCLVLTDLS